VRCRFADADFRSELLDDLPNQFFRHSVTRVVKIFKCVEGSRSSMMDVEDEHNHMRAAFGLRDRIGQPDSSCRMSTWRPRTAF
jgi:hypothetical protein